jgi:hypothetical protein
MVSKFIYKNRNGKLDRVGLFLGTVIKGELRVGYSLCSRDDDFDVDYAVALATARILLPDACPPSIINQRNEFISLCIEHLNDFTVCTEGCIVEVS